MRAAPARRASGGWRLGVLSYQHDSLRWHGALGVLLRPEYVFHRRALSVVPPPGRPGRRRSALGAERVVVEVSVKPLADGLRLAPWRVSTSSWP